MRPNLLAIFTCQSDISAVILLPEVSEARNHGFLKVVPLQANLVGVCHFLHILERNEKIYDWRPVNTENSKRGVKPMNQSQRQQQQQQQQQHVPGAS